MLIRMVICKVRSRHVDAHCHVTRAGQEITHNIPSVNSVTSPSLPCNFYWHYIALYINTIKHFNCHTNSEAGIFTSFNITALLELCQEC